MKIVLTGSSSHLARALLPMLSADAAISRITGIDRAPAIWQHHKYHHVRADLADLDPQQSLSGHDALIHMAWVVLRGRMSLERMRLINLTLSQRWLLAATGMERIIHLSSASVYGQGVNLTESAPMQPIAGFSYAEHKREIEVWLASELPQATSLRPHIILGPNAQPLLKRLLRLPAYIRLPDPQPLLQCVHETDVAQAIVQALKMPVSGAFNLAAPDTFNLRDAIRHNRPHAIGISPALAAGSLKLFWRLFSSGGEPGWIKGANHSLTLDCSRAVSELGWQPRHDSASLIRL